MKKKRNFIIIAILIISCLLLNIASLSVKADSGFGGSYSGGSSGGSSWSGGSSSGGSWGSGSSNYGSSSGSYEGGFASLFIFLIFIIIIVVYIVTYNKKKINMNNYNQSSNNIMPFDINKIKQVIPNFNCDDFRNKTYDIYKDIQVAWMEFDYDKLRSLVTDEMYNMYESQLQTLKVKNEVNVMENFELCDFEITNMETDKENVSITTSMLIACNDYIIDGDTKVVKRGKKQHKVIYNYEMIFIRSLDSIKPNKCPNCNAPLEANASNKCPYCDSIIVTNDHDWVLAKKKVVNQYYR